MKSFHIAWKDFLVRVKDRRGFMLMLLMPLLLTAILGSALSGALTDSTSTFPKTKLGYIQKDNDPLAQQFMTQVIQSKELKPYVSIKKETSEQALKNDIKNENVDVGLVFPEGWSEGLSTGKLKKVTLLEDPGKTMQAQILNSILNAYTTRVETVAVSAKTVITHVAQNPTTQTTIPVLSKQLTNQLKDTASQQLSSVQDRSLGKASVTSMQYYAAAMLVMFILFNITNGAKSILNENGTQTLFRLRSTPTSMKSILIGKFLGIFYFALFQFFVFTLASHYLFGVNWGGNIAQIAVMGVTYTMAVSGLAMLIASLVKHEKTADMIGGTGVQIMALLGGSMVPFTVFPDLIKKIAHIAPNTWALSSFTTIMSGTSWQSLFTAIAVLIILGLVSVTLGTWRLRSQ